jgi:triphosphatase
VSAWPESEARARLIEVIGERPLIERFLVRVTRRERFIDVGGGVLLASIDDGRVEWAGQDAGPIAQFEVEYVRGRRAALSRVARAVESGGIGRPEPRSKLAIAEQLSIEAARVRPDDDFAEAGRKVMRRHLLRLLDREIGTRASDPLARKQMRVATRRLRATWRVFASGFRKQVRREYETELSDLGRALGEVRDLDVLIGTMANKPALGPLVDYWRAERVAAYQRAIAVLQSKRYTRFVADSLDLTGSVGMAATKDGSRLNVAATAPTALRDGWTKLLVVGAEAVATDEPVAWHAVRIEGRRLRYSFEAFNDVLGAAATAELIARVTRLQDHLGAMNDATVAIDTVQTWLNDPTLDIDDATRVAAQEFVASRHGAINELRATVGPVWAQASDPAAERLLDQALAPLLSTLAAQPGGQS